MIKLFGFGENFGLADPSPYVLKINCYLKMSGIDFESVSGVSNLQSAPKSKLPYIEDDGQFIGDSFFILEHIRSKYGSVLDDQLTDEQRAISNLVIRSLDENFYWCIIYSRWVDDDTWPVINETFFGRMPFPLKYIVPVVARRGVKSAFQKQGMGRHSEEEILSIAEDTLESLSVLLADKTYFWGDAPSTLDAVAYGFLAQVTIAALENPLNRLARRYGNLVEYCSNIRKTYYSDQ